MENKKITVSYRGGDKVEEPKDSKPCGTALFQASDGS